MKRIAANSEIKFGFILVWALSLTALILPHTSLNAIAKNSDGASEEESAEAVTEEDLRRKQAQHLERRVQETLANSEDATSEADVVRAILSGQVAQVDEASGFLIMKDGTKVPIDITEAKLRHFRPSPVAQFMSPITGKPVEAPPGTETVHIEDLETWEKHWEEAQKEKAKAKQRHAEMWEELKARGLKSTAAEDSEYLGINRNWLRALEDPQFMEWFKRYGWQKYKHWDPNQPAPDWGVIEDPSILAEWRKKNRAWDAWMLELVKLKHMKAKPRPMKKRIYSFGMELILFKSVIVATEIEKCDRANDPVVCASAWDQVNPFESPLNYVSFAAFVAASQRGSKLFNMMAMNPISRSVMLKLMGERAYAYFAKHFLSKFGGSFGLGLGSLVSSVVHELVEHPDMKAYFKAGEMKDATKRREARKKARIAIWRTTFGDPEWRLAKRPEIYALLISSLLNQGVFYSAETLAALGTMKVVGALKAKGNRGGALLILKGRRAYQSWKAANLTIRVLWSGTRMFGKLSPVGLFMAGLHQGAHLAMFFKINEFVLPVFMNPMMRRNSAHKLERKIIALGDYLVEHDKTEEKIRREGEPFHPQEKRQRGAALDKAFHFFFGLKTNFEERRHKYDLHVDNPELRKRVTELQAAYDEYREALKSDAFMQSFLYQTEYEKLDERISQITHFYEWLARGADPDDESFKQNEGGWHVKTEPRNWLREGGKIAVDEAVNFGIMDEETQARHLEKLEDPDFPALEPMDRAIDAAFRSKLSRQKDDFLEGMFCGPRAEEAVVQMHPSYDGEEEGFLESIGDDVFTFRFLKARTKIKAYRIYDFDEKKYCYDREERKKWAKANREKLDDDTTFTEWLGLSRNDRDVLAYERELDRRRKALIEKWNNYTARRREEVKNDPNNISFVEQEHNQLLRLIETASTPILRDVHTAKMRLALIFERRYQAKLLRSMSGDRCGESGSVGNFINKVTLGTAETVLKKLFDVDLKEDSRTIEADPGQGYKFYRATGGSELTISGCIMPNYSGERVFWQRLHERFGDQTPIFGIASEETRRKQDAARKVQTYYNLPEDERFGIDVTLLEREMTPKQNLVSLSNWQDYAMQWYSLNIRQSAPHGAKDMLQNPTDIGYPGQETQVDIPKDLSNLAHALHELNASQKAMMKTEARIRAEMVDVGTSLEALGITADRKNPALENLQKALKYANERYRDTPGFQSMLEEALELGATDPGEGPFQEYLDRQEKFWKPVFEEFEKLLAAGELDELPAPACNGKHECGCGPDCDESHLASESSNEDEGSSETEDLIEQFEKRAITTTEALDKNIETAEYFLKNGFITAKEAIAKNPLTIKYVLENGILSADEAVALSPNNFKFVDEGQFSSAQFIVDKYGSIANYVDVIGIDGFMEIQMIPFQVPHVNVWGTATSDAAKAGADAAKGAATGTSDDVPSPLCQGHECGCNPGPGCDHDRAAYRPAHQYGPKMLDLLLEKGRITAIDVMKQNPDAVVDLVEKGYLSPIEAIKKDPELLYYFVASKAITLEEVLYEIPDIISIPEFEGESMKEVPLGEIMERYEDFDECLTHPGVAQTLLFSRYIEPKRALRAEPHLFNIIMMYELMTAEEISAETENPFMLYDGDELLPSTKIIEKYESIEKFFEAKLAEAEARALAEYEAALARAQAEAEAVDSAAGDSSEESQKPEPINQSGDSPADPLPDGDSVKPNSSKGEKTNSIQTSNGKPGSAKKSTSEANSGTGNPSECLDLFCDPEAKSDNSQSNAGEDDQ